ncbi:MAG: tRNA pseudouridine(38-40) synthase TruA [Candidatus Polarisedimenticolaceae bacterium]|nr:tRNA pseudouridine(38-40) synthase TruA [Candidatus Polarisedimenticolaceae bacterium]
MRIALGIEYDGAGFHGWQIQQAVRTVQETLELALSRVANHPVRVHCAGRTDTGVHATGQVVHFETDAVRSMRSWLFGTNVNMPHDVSVVWAKEMPGEFHARFSAVGRHYRYVILNRASRSALQRDRMVWCHYPLDERLMHEAGQYLVGTHDFSSYRALGCQAKSPVKTIHRLQVSRQDERVTIDIHANAFLHHMVRNVAGVLMTIGRAEQPSVWAQQVLCYKDRARGGVTARPQGLYLTKVDYPEAFDMPLEEPFPTTLIESQ